MASSGQLLYTEVHHKYGIYRTLQSQQVLPGFSDVSYLLICYYCLLGLDHDVCMLTKRDSLGRLTLSLSCP